MTQPTYEQIQEVHDFIKSLEHVVDDYESLRNMQSMLCWVLGHDNGEYFEQMIRDMKEEFKGVNLKQ